MLNVGIHLTDSNENTGSLRVIPGSHHQSKWSMLTRKMYYINKSPDKHEVSLTTKAGDLTVHHGYIWHRVSRPHLRGVNEATRKVMYLPILCDPKDVKNGKSRTPLYHLFQKIYR